MDELSRKLKDAEAAIAAAEKINRAYDKYNRLMLYGVQAVIREREPDGTDVHSEEMHPGMAGFCAEKDMVQVPLAVMLKWEELRCPDQQILIVENLNLSGCALKITDSPCRRRASATGVSKCSSGSPTRS